MRFSTRVDAFSVFYQQDRLIRTRTIYCFTERITIPLTNLIDILAYDSFVDLELAVSLKSLLTYLLALSLENCKDAWSCN